MIMPVGEDGTIRNTGGQVDDMVMALIDASHDKDPKVRSSICDSLLELGRKQPALVLSSCHVYLVRHSKLSVGHRVTVLKSMEAVLRETVDEIEVTLAVDIIKQASAELTQTREVTPEWQTAASEVLVAIGTKYCQQVMEELLKKFEPGILPHFFVVQTMANLATANVFEMVPFLHVILGTMLPMLGLSKQDNYRWVFSTALARFCEAILDYVANIEKAPDKGVKTEVFSPEVDSAFAVLFNTWLPSREARLRTAIVEALGFMSQVMSGEKLQEQLPRILSGILGLYKKHQEHFHITQALCMVLGAAAKQNSVSLEPHLESIMGVLFPQICQPVDFTNPLTIKNHNELLRCFAVIAVPYSDKLVTFLLQKMEPVSEKSRIGVLSILRHLVNASDEQMADKKDLLLSGLKMVLNDPSNKVKKAVAQTIIAMAHHNYLELEGGQLMLEFVVQQCALMPEPSGMKRPNDPEYVSNDALRAMCDNVLQLLTTTVEGMDQILWPQLLEFIDSEQYTPAMAVLAKNIAHLAASKREQLADDYEINFESQANVPKPPAIVARLTVLAGCPLNGRNRGEHILHCMKSLSPLIHEKLVELWDTVVPKLLHHLEEAAEKDQFPQKVWEDLVLKLLSKSLDEVDEEEWTCSVGDELGNQIGLYAFMPEEKNFLYKCLGVTMRKASRREFVNRHLDDIFNTVKHPIQLEREGCAIAIGFAAASHLDAVLTKLEAMAKYESGKRSSGFFGFIKDQVKGDIDEMTKATLMLCYGYVALYAPASLIVSRLEATILRTVNPHFKSVKDPVVKQNLIRAVELIARAMHPDHLKIAHQFTNRGDLLIHMQTYMKTEDPQHLNSETRALAMDACAMLVKLDPKLANPEIYELMTAALDCCMSLPVGGVTVKKHKEESYDEVIEHEALMEKTMNALQKMLKEILLKDTNPAGLENIFQYLYSWMVSTREHERERAMVLSLQLFRFYHDKVKIALGEGAAYFDTLGTTCARVVPRCSDPSLVIRQMAIDSLYTLLKIALKYEGKTDENKDQMVEALPKLKERVKRGDANILFSVVNDLSKVFCKKIPSDQLMGFIEMLYDGLLDAQSHSSSGACVVMNSMIKARGGELHSQVDRILKCLQEKLVHISSAQTRTGTLRAIRTLASHHLLTILNALLNSPLPFDQNTSDCWQMIGQDAQLTASVIDQLLELLARSLPYEERHEGRDQDSVTRTAMQTPLAATCAMCELYKVSEAEVPIMNNYPRLLIAMLVRIACTVGTKPPKVSREEKRESMIGKDKTVKLTRSIEIDPCKSSVDACKQLLQCSHGQDLLDALTKDEVWDLFQEEASLAQAVTLFARHFGEIQPQFVPKVIGSLNPLLTSVYDPQRVMAAAFFAELIRQNCAGDRTLVDMLVNTSLGRLADQSATVRMLCIRGLGNVATAGHQQAQKYSTTVLSAMMTGMDDKDDLDDDITLEAMAGLSNILAAIDESHIRAILINVSLKIRPCFEKNRAEVRATAFRLFGNLARFGDGPSRDPFMEQIHTNLVSILLHLNDVQKEVREACKHCLKQLGPLLESTEMNTMFQKYLVPDSSLHYGEFMNDLSKAIIEDYPEKLNFYIMGNVTFFRSHWPAIQGNAAMFTGFLLGNMPKERYASLSREHICSALVLLLKDQHSDVKMKAAEAMSWLHGF